jgi:hypothetical protein
MNEWVTDSREQALINAANAPTKDLSNLQVMFAGRKVEPQGKWILVYREQPGSEQPRKFYAYNISEEEIKYAHFDNKNKVEVLSFKAYEMPENNALSKINLDNVVHEGQYVRHPMWPYGTREIGNFAQKLTEKKNYSFFPKAKLNKTHRDNDLNHDEIFGSNCTIKGGGSKKCIFSEEVEEEEMMPSFPQGVPSHLFTDGTQPIMWDPDSAPSNLNDILGSF